jgi:hypothetical protein
VTAVETAAAVHFEGAPGDVEGLLTEGLESPELSEEEFSTSVVHDYEHGQKVGSRSLG